MTIFSRLYFKIRDFEYTLFIKSIGIFFGSILLIIGIMLGYYYTTLHSLKGQITKTKRQQEEVRHLLGKFTQLQEEIQKINTVLDEEKNFKIQSFYDGVLQQYNLQNTQLKDAEVHEEKLRNTYTEIKLTSQLHQISTQQLCNILNTLEKKTRIYVKSLTITKTRNNSLDVVLVIATLKTQVDQKQ